MRLHSIPVLIVGLLAGPAVLPGLAAAAPMDERVVPPRCTQPNPPSYCIDYREEADPVAEPTPQPADETSGPTLYPWYRVEFDTDPESGAPCARIAVYRWTPEPPDLTDNASLELAETYLEGVMDLTAGDDNLEALVRCPGEEVTVDVEAVAIQAWLELVPPAFEPWISPGRALAGLPAYLEIAGPETVSESLALPAGLGQLRIDAFVIEHEVDFDPTDSGPSTVVFTGNGAPWNGDPAQQVSHTYTTAGDRTVTVTTRWGATFTAPGTTGELGVRERTSELPITVNEYRAVRTTP